MSATRKPRAERGLDFYETPAWVVEAIAPHLPACSRILDPCAGRGAILAALGWPHGAWGFELDGEHLVTVDGGVGFRRVPITKRDSLANDAELWVNDDCLRPELVVMNPPFNRALEFVERAIDEVVPGGSVFALLRLAFLEGALRVDFHRRQPADVLVLPRRPSFTGKGTDSSAYAWFAWGPGRGGRWSVLDVGEAHPPKSSTIASRPPENADDPMED